jgi:hypothetical protein
MPTIACPHKGPLKLNTQVFYANYHLKNDWTLTTNIITTNIVYVIKATTYLK